METLTDVHAPHAATHNLYMLLWMRMSSRLVRMSLQLLLLPIQSPSKPQPPPAEEVGVRRGRPVKRETVALALARTAVLILPGAT